MDKHLERDETQFETIVCEATIVVVPSFPVVKKEEEVLDMDDLLMLYMSMPV